MNTKAGFAFIAILAFVAALLVVKFFRQPPSAPSDLVPGPPDSGTVRFALLPTRSAPGVTTWQASYAKDGHTARWLIELFNPASAPESSDFKTGRGRLIHVDGSDASSILPALRSALEAKKPISTTPRGTHISFIYAVLGTEQSRRPGGGFNTKPPGKWTTMKLFFTQPSGEAAEIFLNLNGSDGQAEFSIKDPDYGDDLMTVFAKVL